MFAGHVGAALAIGRAEPEINVGIFAFAALWLDVLLWSLVLLGWESVTIPADFASTHQAKFVFPWSHGLAAALVWSALGGLGVLLWPRRTRQRQLGGALLVGAAVLSHWLLDALVHVPELPLWGAESPKVGLGLWQHMPTALIIEGLLVGVGLGLYLPGARLSRARKLWLAVLAALLFAFTVAGMTIAPPPPSAPAMAGASLATLVAVCTLACWLGRRGRGDPA
jgi:hypothetical protein